MNTQHLTRSSWTRIRQLVSARDGEICQYCDSPAPDGDVDHILPLSKGGRDSLDNLVWSCQRCNREKHDKTLYEWIMSVKHSHLSTIPIESYPVPEIPEVEESITPKTKLESATIWLFETMKKVKEIPSKEIQRLAAGAGFGWVMINRAKRRINWKDNNITINSEKDGARWNWVIETKSI